MEAYQQFIFESYALDAETRTIRLSYSFDGKVPFEEIVQLPEGEWVVDLTSPIVDRALFALHLIGGISYYKAALCPEIVVKSGALSKDRAQFWDAVYLNGLGELLYRNKLNPNQVAKFPVAESVPAIAFEDRPTNGTFLTPFGGGKDSIVTLELLRKAGVKQVLYRNGRHPLIDTSAAETGLPIITTERQLDPTLFTLNAEGAINGHVPITTYLSFLTLLVSVLHGFEGVIWSNERSANFGNVKLFDLEINHQWSKSQEAEHLIREYMTQFIAPDFRYLNMLRPFTELKIAQIFTTYPQYFKSTTSCNRNWRIQDHSAVPHHWCGECAKCAFSFLLFSAFVPVEEVATIFGKNLFADEQLLPLYRELCGFEGIKPFDCVGTPEEVIAAFKLASAQPAVAESVIWQRLQARIEQFPDTDTWQEPEFPSDFPELTKEWLSHAIS